MYHSLVPLPARRLRRTPAPRRPPSRKTRPRAPAVRATGPPRRLPTRYRHQWRRRPRDHAPVTTRSAGRWAHGEARVEGRDPKGRGRSIPRAGGGWEQAPQRIGGGLLWQGARRVGEEDGDQGVGAPRHAGRHRQMTSVGRGGSRSDRSSDTEAVLVQSGCGHAGGGMRTARAAVRRLWAHTTCTAACTASRGGAGQRYREARSMQRRGADSVLQRPPPPRGSALQYGRPRHGVI